MNYRTIGRYISIYLLLYLFISVTCHNNTREQRIDIKGDHFNVTELKEKKYLFGEWENNDTIISVPQISDEENISKIYRTSFISEVDVNDAIIYLELFTPQYMIYVNNELVSQSYRASDSFNIEKDGFSYQITPFKIKKNQLYNITIEIVGNTDKNLYRTPILSTSSLDRKEFFRNILLSFFSMGLLTGGFIITIISSIISKNKVFKFVYPKGMLTLAILLFFNKQNMRIITVIFNSGKTVMVSITFFLIICLNAIMLNAIMYDILEIRKNNRSSLKLFKYYLLVFIVIFIFNISPSNGVIYSILICLVYLPNIFTIKFIINNKNKSVVKVNLIVNYIFLLIFLFLNNMNFYKENLKYNYHIFMIIAIVIFVINIFLYYVIKINELEKLALRTVKIEKELIEKNTALFLTQIKPHFIYNTLATIQSLIKREPAIAYFAIGKFSKYLRTNINSINFVELIDLEKELEHVRLYTEIEKLRFGDRVNIVFNITVNNIKIPALSIQPLVENSIKHGICKKIEGGTVEIGNYEDENNIYIYVKDDGVGSEFTDGMSKDSIGIKNIRYRLKELINAELKIESEIQKGTVAKIIIPK